jgi:hypothetical protein
MGAGAHVILGFARPLRSDCLTVALSGETG